MEHKGTASPVSLIPLVAALRARDVAPEPLLAIVGLAELELAQRGVRVDNARVLAAWEWGMQQGGENIGLEAAALYRPGMFHILDYIVTCAPTLREGIEVAAGHLRLLSDVAEVKLEDDGQLCRISQGPTRHIPVPRAETEFFLACLARICCNALGSAAPFTIVELPHPAPSDRSAARRTFAAPVRYGSEYASLGLPTAQLDRPSASADPGLMSILLEYGALLLEQVPGDSAFHLRVRHQVATVFPEALSLDEAARGLGVSARTLRRKLARQGRTYKSVVDDVRHETTVRLLRDHGLSLEEVAERVGFTSAGTLARAFRRWAGVSPAQFRQSQHE